MSFRDQLNSYIQQLERRLRLGAMFRGAAILTSVALATTVVLVLITNALAFSGWSITSARVALLFALVLAVTFRNRPAPHRAQPAPRRPPGRRHVSPNSSSAS